jgi:UDP-N-acetylglucosamine acyltransferase
MGISHSARIHPTAIIDPLAEIGDEVQIGPYVVIEGSVTIGVGCVIKTGAHLIGPMTIGAENQIHSYAVLGEAAQHLKYAGGPAQVEIGDRNVIREFVTIHRATSESTTTRIGNSNFLMANSHVAHDCQVGDNCLIANGALIAGHCTVQDGVVVSGNVAVHQHVRLGRLSMISGVSATSMDLPPFMINQAHNVVCGVNIIGMRRAGVSSAAIDAVRAAFKTIYRSSMMLTASLPRLEKEFAHVPEVMELVSFIRASKRGITLHTNREAA